MDAIKKILFFLFSACAMYCRAEGVVVLPAEEDNTVVIDTFICKGDTYSFFGTIIDNTGTYKHTDGAEGVDYVLYLSVEDCGGVSALSESDEKALKSNLNCDKVISPHPSFGAGSEGRNAKWIIENIEKYNNVVSIYDRWGMLIYQKKNYTNDDGWDGTFRGSELPSNDYWYAICLDDLGRICYGHFHYKKDR